MEEFIKYSFNSACKSSSSWFAHADNLIYAALTLRKISLEASNIVHIIKGGWVEPVSETETIVKNIQLVQPATMLIGLSFELALKGILIEKYKIEPDGIKFPKKYQGHKLDELANDADIQLTDEEKKVLLQLSKSIEWSGRYPIPLRNKDYIEHWKTRPNYLIENSTNDLLPNEIESILGKIKDKIKIID